LFVCLFVQIDQSNLPLVPTLHEMVIQHAHTRSALPRQITVELVGVDALETMASSMNPTSGTDSLPKPLNIFVDALKFKQIMHNLVCTCSQLIFSSQLLTLDSFLRVSVVECSQIQPSKSNSDSLCRFAEVFAQEAVVSCPRKHSALRTQIVWR
jgi:hypothetical protein